MTLQYFANLLFFILVIGNFSIMIMNELTRKKLNKLRKLNEENHLNYAIGTAVLENIGTPGRCTVMELSDNKTYAIFAIETDKLKRTYEGDIIGADTIFH